MFLKPVIPAPNLARRNLLSGPSNQPHISPSMPNALFRAVLVVPVACPNSGSRSVSVRYDELLKTTSRLGERGQSLDENDSKGEFIHVFDDRRYAKGPNVLRFGAKVICQFIVFGDRVQNRAHFDISSSTGFPVSKTVDNRLLANTSGDTSMNM